MIRSNWFSRRRAYLVLAALTLAFRIGTALPVERAGYMDASYTIHVGRELAAGQGLTEQVLWNYLDHPTAIPHPSNLYWLPLPAILTGASFALFGVSYHAAQIPFILISIVPPLLAFYLARRLYRRDDYAWLAAVLTAFSGFYTIYWIAPDNFSPFAVTAGLALLFIGFGLDAHRVTNWFLAGLLIGLSQLSRADALFLLAIPPLVLFFNRLTWTQLVRATAVVYVGFLLVVAPWWLRNLVTTGNIQSPGSMSLLFLTSYDELFRYDTSSLTVGRFLAWGIPNIVLSKLQAFGVDLLVLVLGALQVFLAPFALIGLWRNWRMRLLQPAVAFTLLLIVVMALVFTFPGMRGSMLHSSSALVAYLAVAVPPGLDAAVEWVAHRRGTWKVQTASRFFRISFASLAIGLSVYLFAQGLVGSLLGTPSTIPLWNERDVEYQDIGQELGARGVSPLEPVLTVDPPSFFNETGRRSIPIPTDGTDAIFQAARQFNARFLVLQYDHPRSLNALYLGSAQVQGLTAVAGCRDALGRPVTLYEVQPGGISRQDLH